MTKTGKAVIIILALLTICGAVWGMREVYLYNNPEVIITYYVVESGDDYLSLPRYAINPRSNFGSYGYAERYNKEMGEWISATNEVTEWIYADFAEPPHASLHVTSNIEIVDGKTIITYNGTAVSLDGELTDIYREIVLDFVVSENLPSVPE